MRRRALTGLLALGAMGTAYVFERALTRHWQASPDAVIEAGLSMPPALEHHFVTTSDGGRIHVVEAGHGRPLVLIHGVTLGVGIWARQFSSLRHSHRVVAIDQRGHGQSIAGRDGYSFERLADDVIEVLESRGISDAIVVGHSMGGMVLQVAALRRPDELSRWVRALVLVATDAGPTIPGPLGRPVALATAWVAWRAARFAGRRGKGLYPSADMATWGSRLCFGTNPRVADVELVRSLTTAVPPRAMAELLAPLLAFDARIRLSEIALPTLVVVGTKDLLTPQGRARTLAERIPDARLEVLEGCGHMVMLERAEKLKDLLEEFSAQIAP